jgi:DnaJ-class molecular chaperone
MASDAHPCAMCGGYGHTCVLTKSGIRLTLICEDCDGEGWIIPDEDDDSHDQDETPTDA